MLKIACVGITLLVSLNISKKRNSEDVLVVPETHFLIRPRPLEGMGVKPVVLRPRGHHMVDVLPTTGPRTALQVAIAEGMVEQLPLIQPRGVGRRQPGTPPALAAGEIVGRLGGGVAAAPI